MVQVPPDLEIVGDEGAEERTYKIVEQMQYAFQQTANYCETLANNTWPELEWQLRAEGLDGGGRFTQLLHGGDARRTARYCVAPLYVVQTDLLNGIRSTVTFGNRMRVSYFDAIRQARRQKERSSRGVPVA